MNQIKIFRCPNCGEDVQITGRYAYEAKTYFARCNQCNKLFEGITQSQLKEFNRDYVAALARKRAEANEKSMRNTIVKLADKMLYDALEAIYSKANEGQSVYTTRPIGNYYEIPARIRATAIDTVLEQLGEELSKLGFEVSKNDNNTLTVCFGEEEK